MSGGRGASWPADTIAPQPSAPRVFVALRWREPRASLSPPPTAATEARDEADLLQRQRMRGAERAGGDAPRSRLCILRRRLPAHGMPNTAVVGLGMRAVDWTSHSVTMEEAVQTPLLAVEGLEVSSAAGVNEAARGTASAPLVQATSLGPSPASPSHTDASLRTKLADLIADALLPPRVVTVSLPPPPRLADPPDDSARSREVLAFTCGPQGSASTAFLFGSALGWSVPVTPPLPPLSPSPHRGLLHAVLERLFASNRAPSNTRAVVALSVTEVRDTAPLRHPSLLKRPRATVDLLSGALLRTEGGGDADAYAEEARPTDIPSACYVRVTSAAEAMTVLYAALATSLGWVKGDEPLDASPPLLRPFDESLEERPCHVCVTVLVSSEPLSTPQQGHGQQTRGTPLHPTEGVTGVWKLWDLANPSVTCGYRPLASTENHSTGAATPHDARAAAAVAELPWSSRYSLAALTQTCLAEASRDVRAAGAAAPTTPLLHCDRSAALPLLASALDSCSLVVPICTVVADAALDAVNAEVLRLAAAWSAYGRDHNQHDQAQQRQRSEHVPRLCGGENAEAAQRVMRDYAVPFAEFVADLYSELAPSPTPPGGVEKSGGAGSAAARGKGEAVSMLHAYDSLSAAPVHALRSHDDGRTTAARRSVSPRAVASDIDAGALLETPAPATQPLSINVTHTADDAVGPSPERAAPPPLDQELRAVSALKSHSASAALTTSNAHADRDHGDGTVLASLLAPPQRPPTVATAASLAAAAAAQAEAARLQRFHALFETDSLFGDATTSQEAPDTAHATADGHGGSPATTATQTPLVKDCSPPPIASTGPRRREARGVRRTLLTSSHGPSVDRADGSRAATEAAEAASFNSGDASSGLPPQALQYDTLVTSVEGAAPAASSSVSPDAALTDRARPAGADEAAAQRSPVDATAALATFLSPYCDEFVRLYATMQADVRAWRAEEAATLAELSTLAARHTRDVQEVAALQRRLMGGTVAPCAPASSPAPRLSVADRDVVPSGGPGDTASRSSAFAATSALIFEQLVRSEEKVAWLERQLVDWRRRAHEASVLDTSSNLVDAPDDSAAAAALTSSILTSPKEDPTKPHLQVVQALLERLLQRCSRTYAAAQQRSGRWHDQLAQEQASASALRQRIAELEAELVGLRASDARSTHQGSTDAPSGAAALEVARAGERKAWGVSTGVSSAQEAGKAAPPPFVDDFETARSSLTAAPLSPIASDTASSLPSSLAASPARVRRHHIDGIRAATPRDELLGRVPLVDNLDRRSLQRSKPSPHRRLAVLLSRAVLRGGGPAPDGAVTTEHASRGDRGHSIADRPPTLAVESLFDVHVGAASADSRADADSRSTSESVDASDGVHQPVSLASRPLQHRQGEERVHASLRSPHGAWRLVPTTTAAHEAAQREARGVWWSGDGDVECAAGALTRRSADASYRVAAARRSESGASDVYPSAALEALGQAAAQLERDATRLSGGSASVPPLSRAPASSHGQRFLGRGTAAWPAAAAAELHEAEREDDVQQQTSVAAPLSASMGRLRAATQAVQREARDAAERERAYLSAVLFAEPDSATTR